MAGRLVASSSQSRLSQRKRRGVRRAQAIRLINTDRPIKAMKTAKGAILGTLASISLPVAVQKMLLKMLKVRRMQVDPSQLSFQELSCPELTTPKGKAG